MFINQGGLVLDQRGWEVLQTDLVPRHDPQRVLRAENLRVAFNTLSNRQAAAVAMVYFWRGKSRSEEQAIQLVASELDLTVTQVRNYLGRGLVRLRSQHLQDILMHGSVSDSATVAD
ncbi:MAG: hypothetical protein V1846_05060 [Candidatus Komeilibacteria bacterium]